MKYFEDAKKMWKELVPANGQADSVQGELVRAVEKLREEAQRNGNQNWDDGHNILSSYILRKLTGGDEFSDDDKVKIRDHVVRIQDFKNPYIADDIYDELLDYVVLWSRKNTNLIPNTVNVNLHR